MPIIYAIVRKGTDKCYVGSTKNAMARKKQHLKMLREGKHHSPYLQNSYDKYGEDEFQFKVLERCSHDERQEAEAWWIETSNACYNCMTVVEGCFKHDARTRRKISRAGMGRKQSKEERLKKRLAQIGKPKHTEDSIRRIKKNNRGKKRSKEARRNIRRGNQGKNLGCKRSKEVCANVARAKLRLISVDGKLYRGQASAMIAFNLSRWQVYHRLESPNYPTWFYVNTGMPKWWVRLDEQAQKDYLKSHPYSKMGQRA